MSYYALSALVNAVTLTVLGLFVFFNDRKNVVNATYAVFCIFIAEWSYCYFVWQISVRPDDALYWSRALMAGAIFIPVSYLHFITCLTEDYKRHAFLIWLGYFLSVVFLFLNFTPLMVLDVRPRMFFRLWPTAGILYPLFLLYFLSYALYSIYLILLGYQKASDNKRNQYKYVLIGTILGYIGGATSYPLWFDIPIPPYGNILISVYGALVGYAIVKYHLMDIRVFLTSAGIFLFVYTFILGFPLWLGFSRGQWKAATFLMALLASAGPFIYLVLKKKAENILMSEQKRYQKILLQASEGMVRQHDLDKLLKLIVYIIKQAVHLNYAAVFIEDPESKVYRLHSVRSSGTAFPAFTIPYGHPFLNYVCKDKKPFTFEELPQVIKRELPETLNPQLVIPSFMQDKLLGFLFLGEKKNKTVFSEDDLDVFITLSNQAALAIENCLFMKEFKQTQERLFNAEKLASIGGMADGLAHQIKNRLNQFSLAGGEMGFEIDDIKEKSKGYLADNPDTAKSLDYLKTCTDSIVDNVKKTLTIVQGILNFARTEEKDSFFGDFSLREIVGHCVNLLKVKHQLAEFPLFMDVPEKDTLYGVKAQVMECVYNLLDNGYEAAREKMEYQLSPDERKDFSPELRISYTEKEKGYLITVRDNGTGVKDANRAKIFSPFFTTKPSSKSGSGIGAYVVKRMIQENHQGKIWFESEYGKGTIFFIDLPKRKAAVQQ